MLCYIRCIISCNVSIYFIVRDEGSVFQNEIPTLRIHCGHFENSTDMRYTSNCFLMQVLRVFLLWILQSHVNNTRIINSLSAARRRSILCYGFRKVTWFTADLYFFIRKKDFIQCCYFLYHNYTRIIFFIILIFVNANFSQKILV
jgi:hypothetical protein